MLNTVTYGTTSAPYLAERSLQQVAHENIEKFSAASRVILEDFYVDDLLTGTDNVEEAIHLCNDLELLLGLLGPCVITAKIMLQELWVKKIDWDDLLQNDLYEKWNHFKTSIRSVSNLRISRCVTISSYITLEIHAFSDASERAYGAYVYLRLRSANDKITVRLLCAKSRVAPVKRLTIPRLELSGASLASRLVSRIKRIKAWCLRFIRNCKEPKGITTKYLTTLELNDAMRTLVRLSQRESFSKELNHEGLIRVGGRLKNSNFPFDKKYPVLISGKQKLSALILEHEHRRLLHGGPQHILASVREHYWLTGGTDYAGRFAVKNKPGRGAKTIKCYLYIFICLTTKAIHLEPVSDLITDAFIATFRRFVSRRGLPGHLCSDNSRNFIGAKSHLDNLVYSPHQGGLWEAGVKYVKPHIKRVLGTTLVAFENFLTTLIQIEAILNSRPMCPLSSSPNDFEPITPSHFLIGRKVTSVPDPDVTTQPKRWSVNYVSELQQRTKWTRRNDNITIGSLVLLKDDNAPPLQWQWGRVIDVHPGSDSVVRVMSVRTNKGVTKRSVMKVCPLPIYNESDCDITEHN
ncbi:hypothetical protein Trydic_g16187 [Trypoxylus dichotomus]